MIRRGEGGRCGEGRAFRVARGVGRWSCFPKISVRGTGTRATIKALPTPHPPLSPLRMVMGLVLGRCLLGDPRGRPGNHSRSPWLSFTGFIDNCYGRL